MLPEVVLHDLLKLRLVQIAIVEEIVRAAAGLVEVDVPYELCRLLLQCVNSTDSGSIIMNS